MNINGAKILVTGGAGLIGSSTIDLLLRDHAPGQVVIFDCIEFNDDFRWIDVVSDLAFLVMDLRFRGAGSFAQFNFH